MRHGKISTIIDRPEDRRFLGRLLGRYLMLPHSFFYLVQNGKFLDIHFGFTVTPDLFDDDEPIELLPQRLYQECYFQGYLMRHRVTVDGDRYTYDFSICL